MIVQAMSDVCIDSRGFGLLPNPCHPGVLRGLWGCNPVHDDRSDFTQSRPLEGDIGPSALPFCPCVLCRLMQLPLPSQEGKLGTF